MLVWDTASVYKERGTIFFEYDVKQFEITPEVIEKALHLSSLDGRTPHNTST